MQRTSTIVCSLAAALTGFAAHAATPRHTFTFDTNIQASDSGAVLTDHGGRLENGAYVFEANEGLTLTSALANPATYSIEMRFQLDDLTSGFWRKLIDFQAQTSDAGLYLLQGQLRFFPESTTGVAVVGESEWATVVLTRLPDGTVSGYVNGALQWTGTIGGGESATNTLVFLRDDERTDFREVSAGRLDYLRIYDDVLSGQEVADLTAPEVALVERDLFVPGDGLLTYDPGTGNEWLDLTQTIDESINSINSGVGGWTDLGFRAANEDEVNALWLALGVDEIGPTSVANVAGVETLHELLGCTFSCNTAGVDRASGAVLRNDGNGARGSTVDVYYNNDPTDARAYYSSSLTLDSTNFTRGIYLVRSATTVDSDNDGVGDDLDNCTETFNADQRDSNADGFGNLCDADLNDDNVVNTVDLGLLRVAFFTSDADADFNGDGTVNVLDLGILRARFFTAPGPSGLAP